MAIGKTTAWATWNSFPDLTETMLKTQKSLPWIVYIFTVMMYSKACNAVGVNEGRQQLFSQGTHTFDMIPPTQQALFQHILQAPY